MHKLVILLMPVLLSACAARVVSSGPRTVVIKAGAPQVAEAQALGEQECAKQGLHARLTARPDGYGPPHFVFDCVK